MLASQVERRMWIATGIMALLLFVLFEASFRNGLLARVDDSVSDLWFRLNGATAKVERVALVELDEATLNMHAEDPLVFWTPHFARATAVLREVGATVIALDFDFSISPEEWLGRIAGPDSRGARSYDQAFRRELASGRLVLAGQQLEATPRLAAGDFLAALPDFDLRGHIGAADLVFDNDGVLRRVAPLAPGGRKAAKDELRLLTLPLLLAVKSSGQSAQAEQWQFAGRSFELMASPWRVFWSGPPGTVPRLSMRELLLDGAAQNPQVQALKGKVVIIGTGYGGTNDVHLTAFGHGLTASRLMSGPEIHAQTLEALLQGRFVDDLPALLRWTLALLLLGAGALVWLRLSIVSGGVFLAATLLLLTVVGWFLHGLGWALPLVHLQLLMLSFFIGIYGFRFSFGERERGRMRELFSRYVSGDVVKAMLAAPDMPKLGGAEASITVLFSDIRNFTSNSEELEPEEVVEMLNRWFEVACRIVQEEGGSLDKFIGDAIMVEFGAPLPQADHARRAIRAALRLVAAAEEQQQWFGQRFAGRNLQDFAIGVGLNSGIAVVGNVGSSKRMEYTAIGDVVNLASRLEGVTKTMGCPVVASKATVEQAGAGVVSGRHQVLAVKGRQESVEVFEIIKIEG